MNTPLHYRIISSPIGTLTLLASGKGLLAVCMESHPCDPEKSGWLPDDQGHHPHLAPAARQLDEYFAGQRRDFDLALDLQGTPFQLQVWQALLTIPYGETASYGEQARRIGNPKAVRAVGLANGRNPVAIIVPCHRVIGANGSLTGFGGGLDRKRFLLNLEARPQLI